MTNEDLQKIIEQFDEEGLKQQGVFGISQYGGDSDESFIRANKEGLELFALELLKSARDTEATLADTGKKVIPFDYEENWIDESSDTFIHYVEPIAGSQKLKPRAAYESTLKGKLMSYGCVMGVVILVISVIIGLVTLFKWLF